MTDNFVRNLARERKSRPYDLLSDSINYWRLFEPSRERGVTMAGEVFIFPTGSQTEAWPLEFPQEQTGALTAATVQAWKIKNLFFYVGLPTPAQVSTSNNDLRIQWKAILSLADNLIDNIPNNLIDTWKTRANRRLFEEKDTLLGNFYGRKPQAGIAATSDPDIFSRNERRLTRTKLNDLILSLKDQDTSNNNVIGNVWDITSSAPASTPPGPPLGKDWDLMVFIVNSDGGREANSTGYFYINPHSNNGSTATPILLENATINNTPNVASRAVRQVVAEPPIHLPPTPTNILIHELTHSFTLGDEYGEISVDTSHPFFNYTGLSDRVEKYANLQAERDVKNAAGNFDGSLVKWRWHRMTKAGVLTAAATAAATGNQFTIPLRPGQAGLFVANDEVFLRLREYGKPLIKNVLLSPKLTVVSSDATANTVTVSVIIRHPDTVATFQPGRFYTNQKTPPSLSMPITRFPNWFRKI
ncbi:MAG: hypothetical protein IPJ82_03655 [Lewinellaceae bacterium]|nr:hypothetical protein [Lewinellaceae bacterium]